MLKKRRNSICIFSLKSKIRHKDRDFYSELMSLIKLQRICETKIRKIDFMFFNNLISQIRDNYFILKLSILEA